MIGIAGAPLGIVVGCHREGQFNVSGSRGRGCEHGVLLTRRAAPTCAMSPEMDMMEATKCRAAS